MSLFSSLAPEGLLITIISLIGVIVITARKARIFAGYREIARDVREIAADLRSQISRDGADLVVSGTRGNVPSMLRFSHSGTSPAVNVLCHAPVNFPLLLVPKERPVSGEGVSVRTNTRLDNSFACYTSNPVQARIFLSLPAVQAQLEKLCCSSNTLLRFSEGKIEVSELTFPFNLARHILNHLDSIAIVTAECRKMPNAGQVKVNPVPRQKRSWALQIAVAAGVLASVGITLSSNRKVEGAGHQPVEEIAAVDSRVIPDVKNWRPVRDEELNLSFINWIDPAGTSGHSRLLLDAAGQNEFNDPAYLLATDKIQNTKRVVWIVDGHIVYDNVGALIGIARVSRDEMQHVRWSEAGSPQETPDGDGLLVLREYDSPTGTSIFFVHNGNLYSGIPADYRSISLN
ncbi:MAG TPA: hypothetical protein VGJ33_05320 [Candidatus Angelobacter sp.]|jgi:hypothetical protein